MKRKILISVILVVVFSLLLVSCGTASQDYLIYEARSNQDNPLPVVHGELLDISYFSGSSEHYVDIAEKLTSLNFLGVTYPVVYQETYRQSMFPYEVDCYVLTADEKVDFMVKKNTNEVVGVDMASSEGRSFGRVEGSVTESSCRAAADALVARFGTVSAYTVSCQTHITYSSDKGVSNQRYDSFHAAKEGEDAVYTFRYLRELSGYLTGEGGEVTITSDGRLVAFSWALPGEYDTFADIVIDSDRVEQTLANKLAAYYNTEELSLKDYTVSGKILVVDDEGGLYLMAVVKSDVEVKGKPKVTQSDSFFIKVS